MITILQVEIVSKDSYDLLYDEGDVLEDYTPEQKKDLPGFQKKCAKDIHNELVKKIKELLSMPLLEDVILDDFENYVESWDDFKAYGIKVKVKKI